MASVTSASQITDWTRLDGVDLLRGLAIFFVLMNHINIRLLGAEVQYLKNIPEQLAHFLVWNGQLGVQMFFVVSGFLITSMSLRRWQSLERIAVRDFYLLRFARIAPLLLLLLVVLSGLHLAQVDHFVVSTKTGGLGRALLAALTFHINVLEARRGYLPANWDILWSLSVEEMFYLFFPLVCGLFGRKFLIPILLLFAVLGPFSRMLLARGNEIWEEYSYLGGMEGIAMGCLTALVASRVRFSGAALRALGVGGIATVSLSLIFSWQAYEGWPARTGINMTILSLGTCMFVIATAQLRRTSPHVLRPLLAIGSYSYEVYLTHMFVVFALFDLFIHLGKAIGLVAVLFIGAILVSGLLGWVVATFYSEPMNRFLRVRFARKPKEAV
jgi:peptidoglycan/LPS O-acetylase OafA/YrhL